MGVLPSKLDRRYLPCPGAEYGSARQRHGALATLNVDWTSKLARHVLSMTAPPKPGLAPESRFPEVTRRAR